MEENNEYTLSFQEAIQKCFNKEGFIVGEQFSPGYYVSVSDQVLVLKYISKNCPFCHNIAGNFMISQGTVNQKYKLLIVANEKNLGLKNK